MKLANGLKVGAEVLLGTTFVIMLIVSISEMVSGYHEGIGLLVPAAVFTIFMWLGWIRPSETGIVLTLLGVIVLILFRNIASFPTAWRIMGGATLATGLLLLGAGWKLHHIV